MRNPPSSGPLAADPSRREFLRAALLCPLLAQGITATHAGPKRDQPTPETPFRIRKLHLGAAPIHHGPADIPSVTSSMDFQTRFYGEILELPLDRRDKQHLSITTRGSTLHFRDVEIPKDNQANTPQPTYHVAFNIPENKIERAVEWAASKDLPLIHVPGLGEPVVHFEGIDAHSIYFWDPAGNLLEFIARHEMQNASDGPFRPDKDILEISEIGLPADDVPALTAELTDKLGIGPYPPTRDPSDVFAYMGGPEGVLIPVKTGRIWLMTEEMPATVHPTEIVVEGARRPGGGQAGSEASPDSANSLRLLDLPYTVRLD